MFFSLYLSFINLGGWVEASVQLSSKFIITLVAYETVEKFVMSWLCDLADILPKMKKKNCDLIIANDVSKQDFGFNSDYNQVSIIDYNGNI